MEYLIPNSKIADRLWLIYANSWSLSEQVADHLGHSNIQTTRDCYARILESGLRNAVEKLDKFSHNVTTEFFFTEYKQSD
mgnify:CR=1 FL=1